MGQAHGRDKSSRSKKIKKGRETKRQSSFVCSSDRAFFAVFLLVCSYSPLFSAHTEEEATSRHPQEASRFPQGARREDRAGDGEKGEGCPCLVPDAREPRWGRVLGRADGAPNAPIKPERHQRPHSQPQPPPPPAGHDRLAPQSRSPTPVRQAPASLGTNGCADADALATPGTPIRYPSGVHTNGSHLPPKAREDQGHWSGSYATGHGGENAPSVRCSQHDRSDSAPRAPAHRRDHHAAQTHARRDSR